VRPQTLGILGLGAIGGSLALQAKRAGIATVLGWSPEPAERVAAGRGGARRGPAPRGAGWARPCRPACVVRSARWRRARPGRRRRWRGTPREPPRWRGAV